MFLHLPLCRFFLTRLHGHHLLHFLKLLVRQNRPHFFHGFQHFQMMGCFHLFHFLNCRIGLLQIKIFHFHDFHKFDLCNLPVRFESCILFFHVAMDRLHFHDLVIGKPQLLCVFEAHAHHSAHPVHLSHSHHLSMSFAMLLHGHILHL